MKTTLLCLLLLLGLVTACSEEDTPALPQATPEFLIAASDYKKWEMIDPNGTIEMNKPLPITGPACSAGEVKNGMGYFYHIYTNGTIEFQDGCGKTATDKALIKGTWAFNEDKSAITVSLTGFPQQTWTSTQLTVSRLVVSANGTTMTFAPTPFRS